MNAIHVTLLTLYGEMNVLILIHHSVNVFGHNKLLELLESGHLVTVILSLHAIPAIIKDVINHYMLKTLSLL